MVLMMRTRYLTNVVAVRCLSWSGNVLLSQSQSSSASSPVRSHVTAIQRGMDPGCAYSSSGTGMIVSAHESVSDETI